ncbi:AT11512p [Coccidioides immitis H538.4]|uniref:Protein arginine methyltransferase NDUFAF7 n=3 Tax=Coccidioides immitis TaxID=5501 RepID=A0A0J8R3N6_COCIT|nr:Hypothetical Protein CIRG_05899 [Coccidioides immitis RMSCC 2394]KMU78313.1 hypothetical protein CISG_06549 [Coccidioides immitis RMSCC 3703]KMU91263.1 AT11512p [Coccidioides immitis H538.4]TPX22763.1 hypothetical protein DIZ76_014642 [Coccidioides immitis]
MSNGATQIVNRLARASRCSRLATPSAAKRYLSSAPQRQWSTPLAKTIADVINTAGPISIAAYMRQCLTSPEGGYYTSRGSTGVEVFGRKGDFVTSPEISQMFGELLGVWMVTEWMAQGRRSRGVQLIEVGPGRGTLMADMLRSVRNFKSFSSSIEAVYLVEASPTLRDIQKQMLCGDAPMEEIEVGYRSTSKHLGVPVVWTEHIRSLPQGDNDVPFIIAHEFFDALPIHAFQCVASPPSETIITPTGPTTLRQPLSSSPTQWRELVVSVNPASQMHAENRLEFRLSLAKTSTPASMVMPEMSERYKALKSTRGSTIEISPESQGYVQEFARRIGGHSNSKIPTTRKPAGAALILDYGPSHSIPVNSLRGIKDHKLVSPFTSPGQVDLSADVDFIALADSAISASPGVEVHGPTEQGSFLHSLGISERAAQLMKRAEDETKRKNIEAGWKRLVERGGGGMGRIYKAMAIIPEAGGMRRPVGFGGQVPA